MTPKERFNRNFDAAMNRAARESAAATLAPCPHCNAKAELHIIEDIDDFNNEDSRREYYQVRCGEGCNQEHHADLGEAASRWNRRQQGELEAEGDFVREKIAAYVRSGFDPSMMGPTLDDIRHRLKVVGLKHTD